MVDNKLDTILIERGDEKDLFTFTGNPIVDSGMSVWQL
jgi:hypothetical protein